MTSKASTQIISGKELSCVIAEMIDNVQSESFYPLLTSAIRKIFKADAVLIEIFSPNQLPVFVHSFLPRERLKVIIADYLAGPYLLNPFYHKFLNKFEAGGYLLEEVAPDDFLNSEYYQKYYKDIDCGDEFCFLFPLSGESGASISLSQSIESPSYTQDQIAQLKALAPIIQSVFTQNWNLKQRAVQAQEKSNANIHKSIVSAVSNFGVSVLTERQCDIVKLLLRGHSSKSTALELNISAATVKTHRHNIFEKLEIRSQAELFSLFIESLSQYSSGSNYQDPLEHYYASKQ